MSIEDLRRRIEEQRSALEKTISELHRAERATTGMTWVPERFYTAYYVLSGLILGVIASWITLGLNIIGAALIEGDPLKLLRVYSTILGGEHAAQSSQAVILMFAMGLHTLTGAVCGAPIHLVYSRFFPRQTFGLRLFTGLWLGVVMWLVNYYGILSWLQPLVLGTSSSTIVDNVPVWVAVLSHIAFTETMVLLQPLAVFRAGSYERPTAPPAAG